jgi:hypothetical protein
MERWWLNRETDGGKKKCSLFFLGGERNKWLSFTNGWQSQRKIGGRGGQKFGCESEQLFENRYKKTNNRKRGAH